MSELILTSLDLEWSHAHSITHTPGICTVCQAVAVIVDAIRALVQLSTFIALVSALRVFAVDETVLIVVDPIKTLIGEITLIAGA